MRSGRSHSTSTATDIESASSTSQVITISDSPKTASYVGGSGASFLPPFAGRSWWLIAAPSALIRMCACATSEREAKPRPTASAMLNGSLKCCAMSTIRSFSEPRNACSSSVTTAPDTESIASTVIASNSPPGIAGGRNVQAAAMTMSDTNAMLSTTIGSAIQVNRIWCGLATSGTQKRCSFRRVTARSVMTHPGESSHPLASGATANSRNNNGCRLSSAVMRK
mmetsp:Transcript_37844/g.85888  ORF Transcript_37844/g.85888 Transcript_37844/m.85888 type:complete len:224 (-) Transcript_37844:148-819(-)